ncbi:thioesterase-like superfamily-domain-containing protein [Camillea tinctor]|nr:thioesterase-like superfamily-domain-containing protein [Camillea tinctor]
MVSLAEQVAVQLQGSEYVSKTNPIRMGNSMSIAYGGCTIAVAVSAANATVSPKFSPYSILGHFHGPASTDQKLHCSVEETRNTRSFATRRVTVKQPQPDGRLRTCVELITDYHLSEPALLDYSAPPVATWPRPDDCPDVATHVEGLRKRGVISEAEYKGFSWMIGPNAELFETRYCLNGVSGQNLSGSAKDAVTSQDVLPLTSKTSAEWQRAITKLETPQEHYTVLAFLMDGGLSLLPLTHNHLWFDDVAACSSLDFALRIFTPDVDMNSWHIKERVTSRGGTGRTYSEGRLWDEKGNLVASMTQQSIMRPKKGDPSQSAAGVKL